MAGNISRENGKKGGRPKGSKTKVVLERDAIMRAYKQRVMQSADVLLNAQLTLAKGMTHLYKIEKYYKGRGKDKKLIHKKPKLVTDDWEIKAYLNGILEDGELEDPADTYYFITTKNPDNRALDSMLDRAFGKASQSIDLTSEGKAFPTPIMNVLRNNSNKKDSKTKQED